VSDPLNYIYTESWRRELPNGIYESNSGGGGGGSPDVVVVFLGGSPVFFWAIPTEF